MNIMYSDSSNALCGGWIDAKTNLTLLLSVLSRARERRLFYDLYAGTTKKMDTA